MNHITLLHRLHHLTMLGVVAAFAAVLPARAEPANAQPGAPAVVVAGATAQPVLRSESGRLVLQDTDGSRTDLSALAGVELDLEGGRRIRIDGVQAHIDPRGQPVWLHAVQVADLTQTPPTWRPMCAPHSDGTREVVALAGRQQADGTVQADSEAFTLSCTSGALAKCRRFGYAPDAAGTDAEALRNAYNACVRMVRADYGGSGQPHTVDGRLIDIFDDLGVQRPDLLPGQSFEAGWDTRGAVCVHHPRVLGITTLAELEERFPRLRGRVGEVCTERFARAQGALVFNRSSDPAAAP